ncbi:uncharacterized protein LOC128217636 [Mya arenaria]|uniref:uncharacterized protein LOC128217636 n=1 Tax=Mya arenaria TaxID=6604 RepID=UPI0022E77D53|nr:uncharacterized protein LOC128217636 [Mya arenaria]
MAESQGHSSMKEHDDISTKFEQLEIESLDRMTQTGYAVIKHVDDELEVRKKEWTDTQQPNTGSKTVIKNCNSVVIGETNIIVQNQDNTVKNREKFVDDKTKKLAGRHIVSTILERAGGTLKYSELKDEVDKELKTEGIEFFSKVSGWTLPEFLTWEKDIYKLQKKRKNRIRSVTLREIYRTAPTTKMQSRLSGNRTHHVDKSVITVDSSNECASGINPESMQPQADVEEWTVVKPQRSRKTSTKPDSEKSSQSIPNDEADLFISTFLQQPFADFDQNIFENIISTGEDDRTIFVKSLSTYEAKPFSFCVDVISLWNTPMNGPSHIVVGIDTDSTLLGVNKCIDEDFFTKLFHPEYFTTMPFYSTEKIMYNSKAFYIVKVNESKGSGVPCVIKRPLISFKRNEIVARKLKQNVVYEASSDEIQDIFLWFSQLHKQEITSAKSFDKDKKSKEILVEAKETENEDELSDFWKEVNGFKKGNFLLITGDVQESRHLHNLGLLPWIAVYDFDINSPENGIFNRCEYSLGKKRCLKVCNWNDDINDPFTENGTKWCFLRGRKDIKESRTDLKNGETEDSNFWYKKVKETIKTNAKNIATFMDCRTLTVIILWPENEKLVMFMKEFLNSLKYELQDLPNVLLVKSQNNPVTENGHTCMKAMSNEFGVTFQSFDISIGDLCVQIVDKMQIDETKNGFSLELPCASDSGKCHTCVIPEEKAAWLAENLDVLYLNAPFGRRIPDDKSLDEELALFRKGGTISWPAMYNVNFKKAVIERDVQSELKKQVQAHLCTKPSDVRLFHSPGAGGTTLARELVWEMHYDYPCVQLRNRIVMNDDDSLETRLQYLHEQTGLPLLLLVDSDGLSDDIYLKQLNDTVTLYVRRYFYPPGKSGKGLIFLPNKVSQREATQLVEILTPFCDTGRKRRQLTSFQEKAREGKAHLYDFGLTVYLHEYQGIVSYVRNCLKLKESRLQPDQKCLAFLSLVQYYGHSSIPCQFFATMFGMPTNFAMDIHDFPSTVFEFVVSDMNAYRTDNIRICHNIIAKEILEQTMSVHLQEGNANRGDVLSDAARQKLFDLCVDFIEYASRKNSTLTTCIRDILTRTFISRAHPSKLDGERTKKKVKLSRLLEDIPAKPPLFTQRKELLNTLKTSFPKSPSFHAHLGRFYVHCRHDEEQEAEKYFREAERLCEEQIKACESNSTQDRDRMRLEASQVYHMFGVMKKISVLRRKTKVSDKKLNEIIPCAKEASELFEKSRINTPASHIYTYAFTDDIEVRLLVCEVIKTFLGETWTEKVRRNFRLKCLIETHMVTIKNLVHECLRNQLMSEDDMKSMMMLNGRYNAIFGHFIDTMDFSGRLSQNTLLLCDRRLKIAAMTARNGKRDIFDYLDAETNGNKIVELVDMYEQNFREMFRSGLQEEEKMVLENEMIAWLQAIRHTKFTRQYSVEEVLLQVQKWDSYFKNAISLYYTFICNALLGIGVGGVPPNKELLESAGELVCNLRKKHMTVIKSSTPREWLGKTNQGFRTLVSADPRMGIPIGTRFPTSAVLALCVGIIAKPKSASETTTNAVIILTVHTKRGQFDVHVRFEPKAAKLQVSTCCGMKVEFNLAFTIKNGYEAYNVKLLRRYACPGCGTRIGFTSEQICLRCFKCNVDVFKDDFNMDR